MVRYKQVYLDYYGVTSQDWIGCENCNKTSVDLHHLIFKSQGGKDNIENLVALCRECHIFAHNSKIFNNELKQKHLKNL